MNRILRVNLLLLAVAFMSLAAAPAWAQNDDCRCDSITINVDPHVICRVTVCWETADEIRCITILHGTSARVPCIPGAYLAIRDCSGDLVRLNFIDGCHRGIGAGPNCCTIDACWSPDGACTLDITPSILDVCPCP